MKTKYISLLSGGLDSVVNLHMSALDGEVLLALTFDYGQRASKQEIKAAQHFCRKLKIKNEVIEIPWLKKLTQTALVNREGELPHLENLDDITEGLRSAGKVWVPNRNGAFLNIAACYAESMGAEYVVPGFNKEEAATFPDNSGAFIEILNKCFSLSTLSQVKVKCFTTDLDKVGMLQKAFDLKIEIKKVWSCYEGGDNSCGKCESCQRTTRALEVMGL